LRAAGIFLLNKTTDFITDALLDLNLAHSLARDLEQAKKDPNTSIEKIEELASRAWQANVAIEKRQIQVCPSFVYL
jgi:hypothetical protein